MTVSSSTARVAYTGDGATTAFAVPFKFLVSSDLGVYLNNVLQVGGYATSGAGSSSGTVTFSTAPLAAVSVVILRAQPISQDTSLASAGPFPAKTVETMADKVTIGLQQLAELITRTLKFPVSDGAVANDSLPARASRPGLYLSFDANGDPSVASGTGADAGLRTDLAATSGAGLIGWIASGIGAVVRTLTTKLRGVQISVEDFGAVGDGTTDDSAAFIAAIASLPASGGEVALESAKRYKVKIGAITKPNVCLRGKAWYPSTAINAQLVPADNTDYIVQIGDGVTQCQGFRLKGVALHGLGTGAKGIKINGADKCSYEDFSIAGFTTQGMYITSSAAQATAYQWFNNGDIEAPNIGTAIGLEIDYGASFVAAVHFGNCTIGGQAGSLWAMKMTRVQAFFTSVWFQLWNGKGVTLLSSGGTPAHMNCSNVMFDSALSTDVLVTIDANSYLAAYISGTVTIDGQVAMPAGNTASLTSRALLGYNAYIEAPYILSTMRFLSGATPNLSYDVTQNEASIYRVGDVLFFKSGTTGRLAATPGSGVFSLEYAGAGEYWNQNTTLGGRTIWRTDGSGNMVLVPVAGQNVITSGGGFQSTGGISAFGFTVPAARPTVTGSRGANAALASLLTTLAATGIIADGTTV